ncbi:MAG: hypothetical protein ABEH65_01510 [Halobacteriales archaeon]
MSDDNGTDASTEIETETETETEAGDSEIDYDAEAEEILEGRPSFEPRDLSDEAYTDELREQLLDTFDVSADAADQVVELARQAKNDPQFGGSAESRSDTSGGALLGNPDYVIHHLEQISADSLQERWNACIDDWGFVHSVDIDDYLIE